MKRVLQYLFVAATVLLGAASHAADGYTSIGGDVYVSGSSPTVSSDSPRDVFAAGLSPDVTAIVAGDLHIAGFDVDAGGSVGQDLYIVGASVAVTATVSEDVTISGFSVQLKSNGSVGGNARIGAGTVTLDAPIAGSLVAAAGEIKLNAPINGDVQLSAGDISFGADARILGKLDYAAPREIEIPAGVIAADRVRFTPLTGREFAGELKEAIDESVPSVWPSFWTLLSGFLIAIVYLLIVAALLLAFAPDTVATMRQRIQRNLGKSVIFGFIGLATLIGMIPVSAITIVGIPFLPLLLLLIVVAWKLGYLLGAYALAMRVAEAFNNSPESVGGKLVVLAIGLVLFSLLNFIPVLGWLANLAIVLIGLGSMTAGLLSRISWPDEGNDRVAMPQP